MFSALVHVHRYILSAQCFIRYAALDSVNKMELIVKSECIIVCFWEDSILRRQLKINAPGNYFIPTSFRDIDSAIVDFESSDDGRCVKLYYYIEADETNVRDSNPRVLEAAFRLQITDGNIIDRTILPVDNTPKYKGFLKTLIETGVSYDIICTNCDAVLNSKPVIFDTVREYHDNYSELAETWFCHRRNNPAFYHFLADTLYFSDVFFYFHHRIIAQLSLEMKDKRYACTMCSCVLSASQNSSSSKHIGFFCDKIMFRKTQEGAMDTLEYKRQTAIKCLHAFVENSLLSSVSCKMVLHSKVENADQCILLWISPQKVAHFLLHVPVEEIPAEIDMEIGEVYKLLYSTTKFESMNSQTWIRDFEVDYYLISDTMFHLVNEELRQSTKTLPSIQKSNFSFAYISSNSLL